MGLAARFSKAGARSLETWARAALLGGAFYLLGVISARFLFPPQQNAVVWLPSGLTLAALLRSSPGRWPAFLTAIFAVETVQVMVYGDPLPVALSWAAANCLRSYIGAALMRRRLGSRVHMTRMREVVFLIVYGGALSCAVSATVGVGAVALFLGTRELWTDWASWWLSDALGALLLAPVILAWWPEHRQPLQPSHRAEMGLVLVLLAVVSNLIFSSVLQPAVVPALPYVSFPFVIWAALRLGPRGASAALLVLSAIAVWHTREGRGPFGILPSTPGERVLSVQSFLAVVGLTATTLAAQATQLRRAERAQRLLAEAGAVLAASLDYRATLPRLARQLVPELASGVGLWVRSREGTLERVAQVGLSASVEEALLREAEQAPVAARAWVGPEERALLLVPLQGQGGVVGSLGLAASERERPFSARKLSLAQDLARRSALAVESARHLDEAREAVSVRDEFMAIAAHELRTPLTALKLRLESLTPLLRRGPEAEDALAKLRGAARQTTRLSKLVESLLDVSRINTGQMQLRREAVDLGALVKEVIEHFSEEARRAGCELSFAVEEGAIGWADRGRVEQALFNLLSNAAKFGRGQPIDVVVSRAGDRVQVRVTDRGIGIAPEALERIFGRFERAVSAREYGGLGLGLFLARNIAEAHGGHLRAESRPGEGSTFILELPAAAHRAALGEAPAPG